MSAKNPASPVPRANAESAAVLFAKNLKAVADAIEILDKNRKALQNRFGHDNLKFEDAAVCAAELASTYQAIIDLETERRELCEKFAAGSRAMK